MTGNDRIRALRERTGKSRNEIASLAGLSFTEYFDLEVHDDELVTVLPLGKIKRVADALGVSTSALFSDEPTPESRHTSYPELVLLVKAALSASTSKEAFEDEIGWRLDAFFESEESALTEYGVEFLQALCSRVGIAWVAALP